MEKKLRILAGWLKDSDYYSSEGDGQLEVAIKRAKQEVKQEIGDYLEEILNGSDEFIRGELNSIEVNEQLKNNPILPF
tara:strand:+ start:165 stop:398 length:234 start_codon:yes stop_codon:yes gene_type:complete